MKPTTENSVIKNRILKGALAVTLLALLPHLARSYDINDGMRIGSQASTNSLGGSTTSVMIGQYNSGSAAYSLAVGSSNYLYSGGYGSIAVGSSNYLTGYNNFAFGGSNSVSGQHAMVVGQSNSASGPYSFTYGYSNQVPSTASQAMAGGSYNIAEGQNSVALGRFVTAKTYSSMVIGQYNLTAANESDAAAKNSWRPADPLFVIGNGTSSSDKKNALVVTKDGTVTINKVPAKGGISMGIYTSVP
jgi:hypothetical protein